MNYLLASYIDFIQTLGILVIFSILLVVLRRMLIKGKNSIELVDITLEK